MFLICVLHGENILNEKEAFDPFYDGITTCGYLLISIITKNFYKK